MLSKYVLLVCFTAGCSWFNSKAEEPECFADTWAGASGYKFDTKNFGCDNAPIEGNFLLDEPSILLPTGIRNETNIRADFELAITEWNFHSSNLEIRYTWGGYVSPGVADGDDAHHVFMTDGYQDEGPGVWAHTYLNIDTSNSNAASDCDIELFTQQTDERGNVTANTWTDVEPPANSTEMSLAAVLRHELGHCVGFKENTVSSSVMNYSSTGLGLAMPSLSTDDIDAVQRIYGP